MTTGPRLIVALDYRSSSDALAFAKRVSPCQCRLKVGLELFTTSGPAVVRELMGLGFDIFLDLKYHDIPNTVAQVCTRAAEMKVWMVNVHLLGGVDMLCASRQAIDACSHKPLLVGVTLLTSHSQESLAQLNITGSVEANVHALASMAKQTGLDGVVCSPLEVARLRQQLGQDFILVTPGIRPAGATHNDQQRVMTPKQAIKAGSDYLVIGRPITNATDPPAMLEQLNQKIGFH